MIDFHNHIIPNLDDGSKSLEISISMLHTAASQGITDVVNTVHYQSPRMDGKRVEYDLVKDKLKNLQSELNKHNISIRLHLGAEVFYLPNLMDLKDNPLLTFGHGKYMLIEFPFEQVPNGCHEVLFQLKIAGITPIIAHPERIKPIQKDISIVRKFIRAGCIIQLDAGSLTGSLGNSSKKASLEILRQNCCHLIGSDAHDDHRRNFLLADALEIAKGIIGGKAIDLVTINPGKILSGDPIKTDVDILIEKPVTIWEKIIRRIFS